MPMPFLSRFPGPDGGASLSSQSLLPLRIPQRPQSKRSLLCGATLPFQTAPKRGAAPCCRPHHVCSESHGDQTPVRLPCSLQLSSLSARLKMAGTTLGVCLGYFVVVVVVIKRHDQGHLWKGLSGLTAQWGKSLSPSWQESEATAGTAAERSQLNPTGAGTLGMHGKSF